MFTKGLVTGWLLGLSSLVAAVPNLIERGDSCTNGPTSRSCWTKGFNTATDYDDKFPDTGKTVKVNT
jgi:hypothetical protein